MIASGIFEKIPAARNDKRGAALCIVVSAKGSVPAGAGSKMIVYSDRSIDGTIGGGSLEKKVTEDALRVMEGRKAELFRHDLKHQHNMCCGGTVDIYIEPVMKKNKLYIFGAGHTGHALAKISEGMDFEVVVIDERKEYLDSFFPAGVNKMNLKHEEALPLLPFDENTYICIMTYSHRLDREILAYCIKKHFAYLGMIGSRRKVEMTKKMFSENLEMTEEDLNRVDMPMGVDIGAGTPGEIALSILAKIVSVKNNVSVWEKELHL